MLFLSEEFAEGADVPAWILVVHLVSVAVVLVAAVVPVRERAPRTLRTLSS
jgi:hypothetical protein